MSSTIVRCNVAGCGEPAAYKIAAPWSDGAFTELKTYGHACSEHLGVHLPRGRAAPGGLRPPAQRERLKKSASIDTNRASAIASSSGSGGSKRTTAPDRHPELARDRTMTRNRIAARIVALAWLAWPLLAVEVRGQDAAPAEPLVFTVKAGKLDREKTPIRFEVLRSSPRAPTVRARTSRTGPVVALPRPAREQLGRLHPRPRSRPAPGQRNSPDDASILPEALERRKSEATYELYT